MICCWTCSWLIQRKVGFDPILIGGNKMGDGATHTLNFCHVEPEEIEIERPDENSCRHHKFDSTQPKREALPWYVLRNHKWKERGGDNETEKGIKNRNRG